MNQSAQSLLLELFYFELSKKLTVRCFQLYLESTIIMTFALALPLFLKLEQGGIIALFLFSASLMVRMQFLIDEHRDNIWVKGWEKGWLNWRAHFIFAASTSAMFVGMLVTIEVFYFLLTKQTSSHFFEFIFKTSSLQQGVPLAERFGSFLPVFVNNFFVLCTTIILTVLYRSLGMILILSWNAFVWATVLGLLLREAWVSTKISWWLFSIKAVIAVSPHLLVETLAYILGAMAALFFSKALTKYNFYEERFISTMRSSTKLLVAAALLLVVAAALESIVPLAVLNP